MPFRNWMYTFVRKRTKPIEQNKALLWKKRLSLAYGLLAWNAVGIICYMIYTGKADWAHYHGLKTDDEKNEAPGYSYAKMLGIDNAKVYRISKFEVVDEYDIVEGEQKRNVEKSVGDVELLTE